MRDPSSCSYLMVPNVYRNIKKLYHTVHKLVYNDIVRVRGALGMVFLHLFNGALHNIDQREDIQIDKTKSGMIHLILESYEE